MPSRWSNSGTVFLLIYSATHIVYGVRFTVEPVDQVIVLSQTVWLNCSAVDDTDPISYSWRFDDVNLSLDDDHILYSNGTLLVRTVKYDDFGSYTCLATAGQATAHSAPASLDIAYVNPIFSVQPIPQIVMLGDTVLLSCYINSLPTADIRWTLDGKNISSGTVLQDSNDVSILTLSPVMYYNAGTYKCVGTNPLTGVYRYSSDAFIHVQGQPVFLSSLKSVSVPLGYPATFVCYFHGNPEPHVTWFVHYTSEDGSISSQEIQDSKKYRVYGNGTFIIYDVVQADEAFYTCSVGNSFGDMSESASLTVTGAATLPVFTATLANQTVTEGDYVMFLCSCSGNPEPSIIWKKGHDVVSETGNLSISEIQSEDTGWFTCLCENDVGSVNQSVYLDVYSKPVIQSAPRDRLVEKGRALYIDCIATGNPAPSISWMTPRFGTVVVTLSEATVYQNGSLHITSVTLEDTGRYKCLANNVVGDVIASSFVRVQVAPEMTMLPLSQGVQAGSRVYMHCQAKGVPPPAYIWSKDGEGVIQSTALRQIYLNNTMVIHSVTRVDGGIYRCLAGNVRGTTQAVATITVTVPPSFRTVPHNYTVRLGSSVQFHCLADGDPIPTQTWMMDDRQLTLDDNMLASMDQSLITITNIRASQFGKYTCMASNIAGTKTTSAWLLIYDIPVFTFTPENTIVNQSANLALLCQGMAIEAPSVSWYKGREAEMILLESNYRVTVTNSGHLQIQSVKQEFDEGWYTCIIWNTAGQISKQVYVNVQVPPRILLTNSPQSAVSQLDVTLTCQSLGDPTPSLQWISPSGHVIHSSSTYQITDHTLTIVSANEYDAGNWTCQYCNQLGCDSAFVKLYIEGLPVLDSFTGAEDGSFVTLECALSGVPRPSVTFTSHGQHVTSSLEGHVVKDNRMLIDREFVRNEYKCIAGNIHGTVAMTITVPSQMEVPTIIYTESRYVTLSWSKPISRGNLPLTGYSVQMTSDLGVTWQPAVFEGHDLLTFSSWNVTELTPYTGYRFRMAARNILGDGAFSEMTPNVTTPSAAPTAPLNVVALEIASDVILLQWDPPRQLNAPAADVVYEYIVSYKDMQPVIDVLHRQGTLLYNQTRQVELEDLKEPVAYRASVWASNVKLNQSSEHVFIVLDFTGAGLPEAEPHSDDSYWGMDKVIAIVLGSLGGLIVVIIIVFVVSQIHHRRKTKSLSLLDHRLSLDQFYMENPKNLYNDEKFLSKRKSGHSFYSFDQDESFHSTMGTNGKHNGSVEYTASNRNSDVLLVSRNPLYQETELQSSVPHTSSRDQLYIQYTGKNAPEPSCVQSEIELPDSDIALVKYTGCIHDDNHGHQEVIASNVECSQNASTNESDKEMVKDAGCMHDCQGNWGILDSNKEQLQNTTTNNLEDDLMDIYCSMNNKHPEVENADQSFEHIYTSIHSADHLPAKQSDHTTSNSTKSNNSSTQKPPIRVLSPERFRSSPPSVTMFQGKNRCTRSASPGLPAKGHNSSLPKPPVKVLSLYLLRPAVKADGETNIKRKNLKILAGSLRKEDVNMKSLDKTGNEDFQEHNGDADCLAKPETSKLVNGYHDFDETCKNDNYQEPNYICDKILDLAESASNSFSRNSNVSNSEEHNVVEKASFSKTTKGDNSVKGKKVDPGGDNLIMRPIPKNIVQDNFLTEDEIKEETTAAQMY